MLQNRRNVTFIQNQENWFRTSAFLKIIRIKFWRRLYTLKLTLNAMRLILWSCYVDVMEISTFWQNSEAEIQRNRFCKSSSDGKEQLNWKQHTSWDFLVPIPCLLYESINNKSSKMCPKISCFWKILPTWVIPAKQGRVRSTLHCHCVPWKVGSKMLELDLNVVGVFQMGYNIRNVRHRVSVIFFCMLEVTYFITI